MPAAAPLVTARGVAVFATSAFSPLNPDFSLICSGGSEYPARAPGRADGASYVGVFASNLGSLVSLGPPGRQAVAVAVSCSPQRRIKSVRDPMPSFG